MKSVEQRNIAHEFSGEELESVLVADGTDEARPTVILIPTVMGVSDLEIGFARDLVGRGYNGFVADIFGRKFRGADIAGVAAFHGLFDPCGLPAEKIKAKVVAFHGWDDPMVPPEAVVTLATELTEAGADWQIHAYGHTGHGFTNPKAHEIGIEGVYYVEAARRRSFANLYLFLDELFG